MMLNNIKKNINFNFSFSFHRRQSVSDAGVWCWHELPSTFVIHWKEKKEGARGAFSLVGFLCFFIFLKEKKTV